MKRLKFSCDNCILILTLLCVAALAVYLLWDSGRAGILTAPAGEDTTAVPERSLPDQTQEEAAVSRTLPAEQIRLDLNQAGMDELMDLPGIGETLAQRILDYRRDHGGFSSVEELKNVNGIGEGKFRELEDLIEVNGQQNTTTEMTERTP